MPEYLAHREQAHANRAFAEQLLRERRDDPTAVGWAVTAAFYCALHCLEAELASAGQHSKTHAERRRALADRDLAVPWRVQVAYGCLQDWSEQARYDLRHFDPAVVEATALRRYLRRVTDWANLGGS